MDEYRLERFRMIEDNLERIRDNIGEAAIKSGRNPDDVSLMAVTKTVEPCYINHAIECGVTLIGENKVQEFLGKKDELDLYGVEAHLIGHLQTNKVRQIVGEVSMIESVDRIKVAGEISKQSKKKDLVTDILLQVNIGNEESKTGFSYDEVKDAFSEISELPGLRIRGLMAIPPICEGKELRDYFARMRQLYVDIKAENKDNDSISVLSMGMSSDYVPAILEGATLVRVGSSIFGERTY